MLVHRALERELRVYSRTWRGNAFSLFVSPVMFLGAIGLGLGGLVEPDDAADLGGLDYLDFVTPGLMVAWAMLSAAAEGMWPVMGGIKWMGQFKGMVATELGPADVYGGIVTWAGTRAVMGSIPFLVVATLFGGVDSPWGIAAVVPTVVGAVAAMAVLAAYSAGCEDDHTFPLIMRVGVFPLFLFSGTFFPVSQLPRTAELAAWLSPLWHAAESARDCTTGEVGWSTAGHSLVLVALTVAVWRWGVTRFAGRLTP